MTLTQLVSKAGGGRALLLGNEAVVRGAIEAGVGVATTYPGTPVSEVGDTFREVAKDAGIYFEYSANEKLAFETAYGASLAGARAVVAFKQYGFSVAADSIMPSAYFGVRGGLVIVVGDDPGCYSSVQSELDSRNYSRLAKLPTLEPSDAEECRVLTKLGIEISETYDIPVILRLTTRVAHSRSLVNLEEVRTKKREVKFVKDGAKFNLFAPSTVKRHEALLETIKLVRKFAEASDIDRIYNKGTGKTGIIAAGLPFQLVMEALEILGLEAPVLKLGFTYPIAEKTVIDFISTLDRVLVVEELDPIIEEEVVRIAKGSRPALEIHGKDLLSPIGDYGTRVVTKAVAACMGATWDDLEPHIRSYGELQTLDPPRRTPVLCPGCPHRASYFAVKSVAPEGTIFGGDIGCYALGILAPLEMVDYSFAMGASEGIAHGIAKAANQKVVAFLGDSTFYHAGIEGLVNIIQNKSNPLIIVLDNNITAMTGHQPNPASGVDAAGEATAVGSIEEIARAVGVKDVKVVNPFNQKEMRDAVKEYLSKEGPALIVARRECWLLHHRDLRRQGKASPMFTIDTEKCTKCGVCVFDFGCPAFEIGEDGSYSITDLCLGCAACVQVCPEKAIHAEPISR